MSNISNGFQNPCIEQFGQMFGLSQCARKDYTCMKITVFILKFYTQNAYTSHLVRIWGGWIGSGIALIRCKDSKTHWKYWKIPINIAFKIDYF